MRFQSGATLRAGLAGGQRFNAGVLPVREAHIDLIADESERPARGLAYMNAVFCAVGTDGLFMRHSDCKGVTVARRALAPLDRLQLFEQVTRL